LFVDNTVWVSKWEPIGPSPILRAGDSIWHVTGRIEAAAPDPTNPDILYAAGACGGVWKTTDSASSVPSWIPLTDHMPSLDFSGYHPLMVHPSNHNLILGVVSGEGAGLLLSDDAGQTWDLLGNNMFNGTRMGSIAVHQTNEEIFYIGVGGGGPWAVPGVYESTNGGLNWIRLNTLPGGMVSDVIVTKFDSNILYAAVVRNNGASTSNNGIYRSPDGGASWQLMNGLPSGSALIDGAVRLESGSVTGVIYLVILTVDVSNNIIVERFKTSDDGNTWTRLAESAQSYETRSWHVLLGVDPNDDNHIFVNDDDENSSPRYCLYESFKGGIARMGGTAWYRADVIQTGGGQPAKNLGYDWVNISFDANGNSIVTSDQGIYRYSKNKKWTSLVGNLQINQFYTITPELQSTNVVYGIGQDDYNAVKFTGSNQWVFMADSIGECGKILIDPTNTNFLYAYNPLDKDNFVRRSTDGGNTWKTIITTIWGEDNDFGLAYSTQKSFVMDPSNPTRLLLGTTTVHETTNALSNNPNWTTISNVLSPSNNVGYQYITALAIAPSDGDTIYAATKDGHLWTTFNGGVQWDNYDNGLFGVADGPVIGISINPAKSMQGFAVTSRVGGRSIWKFQIMLIGTPSNMSLYPIWSNISGNFPNTLSVYSMVVDWEGQIPFLYVGTDRGVYYSADLGNSWEKFGNTLPNTVVYDLSRISPKNILVAGTHGRGAWRTKFPKIDFNFDLAVKWFPWMLWIPPPPPERRFQLQSNLGVDKVRSLHAGMMDASIHWGRKPGQPISAPDEFEHVKDKKRESQNK
jgi:hypothetical protein